MRLRDRMKSMINELVDGHVTLDEAIIEFEKLYIEQAMVKYSDHLSNTASALGIHRNTLAKRIASYDAAETKRKVSKNGLGKRSLSAKR